MYLVLATTSQVFVFGNLPASCQWLIKYIMIYLSRWINRQWATFHSVVNRTKTEQKLEITKL